MELSLLEKICLVWATLTQTALETAQNVLQFGLSLRYTEHKLHLKQLNVSLSSEQLSVVISCTHGWK